MPCPKPRIVDPITATSMEQPLLAVMQKIDPDFVKDKRFERSYEFGKRRFKEDVLSHGAYVDLGNGLNSNVALTYGRQDGTRLELPIADGAPTLSENPYSVTGEDGAPVLNNAAPGETYLNDVFALIDQAMREANGFCDPVTSYGNITTGTGAGGANPGQVPSFAPILAEDGGVVLAEDGLPLSTGDATGLGVIFDGG